MNHDRIPCVDIHEIQAESGYSHPTVVRALQALRRAGYAAHPRKRTWLITERGKIALAIRAGREHRRLQGVPVPCERPRVPDVLVGLRLTQAAA